jgi:tetratricopeptide (TPR) repeat protein
MHMRRGRVVAGLFSSVGPILLICGFVAAAGTLAAGTNADVETTLRSAAELLRSYDDQRALELYEEILAAQPDHREALGNAAYLHIRVGWLAPDTARKRRHYQAAYDYAMRLYQRHPDGYDSHLVMGAAKAKMAGFVGKGEKVRTARELEEHARFLLRLRSDNPDVWYLFGWWHFELSRVSLADRIFAALLFGGLPDGATMDQAIGCLQKAIALRPGYTPYHHDLGFFYEKAGDFSAAGEMYRTALGLTPAAPEDKIFIDKSRRRLDGLVHQGKLPVN